MTKRRFFSMLGVALAAAMSATAVAAAQFELSYTAGGHDVDGRFMGGTELRNLTAHQGRLYSGNGYWEDRPGAEGIQGAQVFRLESASGPWRIEHVFDEKLPDGRARHLAISALQGVDFQTDRNGRRLPGIVSMLLAGTWDLSRSSEVFGRDDSSGRWTAMPLPVTRVSSGIQQIRAFGFHRDPTTGVDRVFAGNNPYGIFSGAYEPDATGHIAWTDKPELDLRDLSAPSFAGLALPRVAAFAECNGSLYAAVGQQVYRRVDGAAARWQLVYTNPKPGHSETGLRGLTAIPDPAAVGETLLATVEGTNARIVRIDPATGAETTELTIQSALDRAWDTKVGYVIAGYNEMTMVADGRGGFDLLIGLEVFLPAGATVPIGHARVNGLDGGAWYLVRHADQSYELHRIAAVHPVTGSQLVATRTIARSPFADDPDRIYFGGFDANKLPAHNTAWIFSAPKDEALRGGITLRTAP